MTTMNTDFQTLESKNGEISSGWKTRADRKSGSALIVALWALIILSILIGGFAFDMQIESGITAFYRNRIKAQYLARAGVEYAKFMLVKSFESNDMEESDEDEELGTKTDLLGRGMSINITRTIGEGKFTLDIIPEQARRNINLLDDEDWAEVLDQGGIPEEMWPDLIDCFDDWVDEGDEHRLNGAENDDSFYEEKDYEVKNAAVDTVDELLLIKHFDKKIVYGGPPDDENDEPYYGIAQLLTTWGDGKVNVNTASEEVLLTLPGIEQWVVDDIMAFRMGTDEESGTKDDGFESVDDVISRTGMDPSLKDRITVSDRQYVRIVSIGESGGVRNGIWCILSVDEANIYPVFWREENMQ